MRGLGALPLGKNPFRDIDNEECQRNVVNEIEELSQFLGSIIPFYPRHFLVSWILHDLL